MVLVFFWSKAHTKMGVCLQPTEKIISINWQKWLLACGWCRANASKINYWNVIRRKTLSYCKVPVGIHSSWSEMWKVCLLTDTAASTSFLTGWFLDGKIF